MSFLAKRNLKRLNIDPRNVQMKWVMDFCAQALRDTVIGLGGDMDGFMMRSGFAISVSSEVMAILAIFKDLKDMRTRMGKIVVAYDKQGNPVTTRDLEVDGAMTAWMVRAANPNLMQSIEGQPVMVHAGPFANIAVGQSSVVADQVALKLSDYHVTESGFGADIGFEKFWDIKTRLSGLTPNCAVVVATVRALKMHGGGPKVTPGKPLDEAYTKSNPALVDKGIANLIAHIETVKKSGIKPVVCINKFHTDSQEEIDIIRRARRGSRGARGRIAALAQGRGGGYRSGGGRNRRLQGKGGFQIPLPRFHAATAAYRNHRQRGLWSRRRYLHTRSQRGKPRSWKKNRMPTRCAPAWLKRTSRSLTTQR